MRLRVVIGFLAIAIVCSAQAQWAPSPTPTSPDYALATKAGIGGPIHSTVRLRLTEAQGVLTNGPFFLTFGSAASLWWGFRLDTGNHLHLDRDSDTGWAEGFVFKRDGNFGIGVDPQQLIHAARDHNAGTILRLSNAGAGVGAYTATQYTEGATVKAEIRSIGSGFTTAAGGANALHLWNYANGPAVFATNNLERMRIFADGNVTIGGPNNLAKLAVLNTKDGSLTANINHRVAIESNIGQNDTGLLLQAYNDIPGGVTNSGSLTGAQAEAWNFGPAGRVDWVHGGVFRAGNYYGTGGMVSTAAALRAGVVAGTGTVDTGYGLYLYDTEATADWGVYQLGTSDTNYFAGNVIIGGPPNVVVPANNVLYVKGESYFDGTVTGTNIKAHYQDLAEWVPSTTDLPPGSVVILNRDRNNEVMASSSSYDTGVAGVVSAQPGITLGIEGEGKEQIATTGRVKVRVDARTQPIRVGDLLVTSDLPGTAMRSEPMSINGRQFHQPGTIIGKALEPLESGVGEILVLLSMQ